MANGYILDFEGGTVEEYQAIVRRLDETHMFHGMAAGGMFHACTKTATGLRIFDFWHSAHAMETFVQNALVPLLTEMKIAPPKVTPMELVSLRR